jgi:tungstate transport system permease protein
MGFIWEGVRKAVDLLVHGDSGVFHILAVTLHIALFSTALALLFGLPCGLCFGLGRFRGRRVGIALLNAGLALPPVLVGLVVFLFLLRSGPFGGLELVYTVNGIIVAQAILAFPVVAAFTGTAVQAVPAALFEQARALGASRAQLWTLALREARVGVMGAVIAAFGSALSEVGAVVLVGGNIAGQTQTLASAVLTEVATGEYGTAIALGILLLGLILVCGGALTLLQQRGEAPGTASATRRWRAS